MAGDGYGDLDDFIDDSDEDDGNTKSAEKAADVKVEEEKKKNGEEKDEVAKENNENEVGIQKKEEEEEGQKNNKEEKAEAQEEKAEEKVAEIPKDISMPPPADPEKTIVDRTAVKKRVEELKILCGMFGITFLLSTFGVFVFHARVFTFGGKD